jgi:putative ubiquitin-RnfH superfamily antitoxin RatB of RatAB toxin-antitoxin module
VRVEVAFSAAPRQIERVAVTLPPGATVGDALAASGLVERHGLALATLTCGVWGLRCDVTRALIEGDRVDVCRPLVIGPKEARRLRSQSQHKAKRPAQAGRS